MNLIYNHLKTKHKNNKPTQYDYCAGCSQLSEHQAGYIPLWKNSGRKKKKKSNTSGNDAESVKFA